jgi:molybdopterin-binding protein
MRKILAIVKGLLAREISIDIADKTPVSSTPGDVTEIPHN